MERKTRWDAEDQNSATHAGHQTKRRQRNAKYVEEQSLILDVTAGNRTMWTLKDHQDIIYIDMERELINPPTFLCDSRHLPFRDNTFDTVFFDPPHMWGVYSRTWSKPNLEQQQEILPDKKYPDPYYGIDKYGTKTQLIGYVVYTVKELYRVLKPDGLLWFKWNDCSVSLRSMLTLFAEWDEILRIKEHKLRNLPSKSDTYWVAMIHKKIRVIQSLLG